MYLIAVVRLLRLDVDGLNHIVCNAVSDMQFLAAEETNVGRRDESVSRSDEIGCHLFAGGIFQPFASGDGS